VATGFSLHIDLVPALEYDKQGERCKSDETHKDLPHVASPELNFVNNTPKEGRSSDSRIRMHPYRFLALSDFYPVRRGTQRDSTPFSRKREKGWG
jgi:hypothetical protein